MTQLNTTSTADEDRFAEIVQIIELTRRQTVLGVNSALVKLYFQLGAIISRRVAAAEWGDGVMTQLAAYIARTQRVLRGFTRANPFRMRQFCEAYAHDQKVSALPRQLPWTHNLIILSQNKWPEEREFYLRMAIQERRSSRTL
ncbi:MAG: DUF1016 N-terminal domain-containing protein [Sphaerotilus sulfidivorans]|uniref:DUF1016 N-terminal domain-containing protein n=1 Tax=Sphaerotilus sulfidivorans TaxID=639200 RepID=UPI003F414515